MLLLSLGQSVLTSFPKQMEMSIRNWKGKAQKPYVGDVCLLFSSSPVEDEAVSCPHFWEAQLPLLCTQNLGSDKNWGTCVHAHSSPFWRRGEIIQIRCYVPLTCWRNPLVICQSILPAAFPNAIQLGGDRESSVNKPSLGAMLILMASQGLLAALWCVDSSTGHVVCSLPARRGMWMACFGRVVCLVLIISWYLCFRRELAAKAGGCREIPMKKVPPLFANKWWNCAKEWERWWCMSMVCSVPS